MKVTAVPITRASVSHGRQRMLWDSDLQYTSMMRWAPDWFVPVDGLVRWRRTVGLAARAASKVGDGSLRWRRSSSRRWLRDLGQVLPVHVSPETEVLYGHIAFPVARAELPTVWSTAGVIDARPGSWIPEQSARTHAKLIRRAAAVTCWSELGKHGLIERLPEAADVDIAVVPPLVILSQPPPLARTGPDPVAIFIGADGRLKGVDSVVAAARLVPEVRFEIITHTARPAELPANVDWLGPRPHDEVLARLGSAAIHVFPSTTESLGGVVVESMAAGVAQVVAAGAVTAEVMGDGGLTVDVVEPEAIAEAVRRLAGDEGLRRRCAAAGRERYAATYSPDAVGPQLEALIDKL